MVLRGLIAVSMAVAIISEATQARADAAEVEALIAKGNELRRAGTPGPALPYFQKAYQLARTPRTSGQLGLAELAAGYPVEAAEHLAAALQSPNDPSIVKYRQMLADALTMARSQIGELTVQGTPPRAEVVVDGRTVGALPLASPIKAAARNAEVVVRSPGYTEERRIVPIAGGQRHELTVNLAKIEKPAEPAAPVTAAPGPHSSPAGAAGTAATTIVESRPPDSGTSSSATRTAAWMVGGGALAAAGTGLALNLAARSKRSEFDAACKNDPTEGIVPATGTLTKSQCRDRYDAWASYRRWSIVGYASGAALAVTSGVLFWVSRPTSAAKGFLAGLICAPTPYGLSCESVF